MTKLTLACEFAKNLSWIGLRSISALFRKKLIASPALLKRLDFPKDLQDLAQNYPLSGLIDPKLKHGKINAEQRFMPNRAIFFASDVQSELQSALAGRTCSYLINSVCDPYLENSRLVELFPEIEKQKWQLYLYTHITRSATIV